MSESIQSRRKFLKYLGVSSAGIAFVATVDAGREKIQAGGEDAKKEIVKLQKKYNELDKRTKLLMRAFLFFTGVDIFLLL